MLDDIRDDVYAWQVRTALARGRTRAVFRAVPTWPRRSGVRSLGDRRFAATSARLLQHSSRLRCAMRAARKTFALCAVLYACWVLPYAFYQRFARVHAGF